MNPLIENRISKRNFTKEKLSTEGISKIKELIYKINKESNLKIEFLEDGSKAFSKLKKSYGIFSNVRSMILMKGNKKEPNLKEKIGYFGEEIVLDIVGLDLGTCWVGGTYEKNEFKIEEEEELVCVIVIGHTEKSLKDNMIRKVISKNRKNIEQRIITDKEIPSWIKKGLEAVKLAPSAKNSQKVMFQYKDNILSAYIDDDYYFDLVDLGIAKKHFELETNGKFEWGNGGQYKSSSLID